MANSILEKGKQEDPIVHANFAVIILRFSLEKLPASHPMRSRLLSNLVSALLARFWHGSQHQDLDNAFMLCIEAFKLSRIEDEEQVLVRNLDLYILF